MPSLGSEALRSHLRGTRVDGKYEIVTLLERTLQHSQSLRD